MAKWTVIEYYDAHNMWDKLLEDIEYDIASQRAKENCLLYKGWKKLPQKLRNFIIDWNFCEANNSKGQQKGSNIFYEIYCKLFYPLPQYKHWCGCCASFRGILYGMLLMYIILG